MSLSTSVHVAPSRRGVAILFAVLVANAMGHAFVLIVLPPLGRAMGFTDLQTGLLISVSALVLMLSAPFWGHLCEGWGRRRVLGIGLGAAALFPALLALLVELRMSQAVSASLALALLLGLRLLQVAVAGGIMPAAQAYLADVTSAERRVTGMGLMGAAFGIGTVAGGALALAMGGSGLIAALFGLAVVIALVLLALWRALPESARPALYATGVADRVDLLRILPFLGVTVCGIATYSLLQQVTALRMQDQFGLLSDASIRAAGAAMMVTMVAMILAQGLLIRQLAWSPARLLRVGTLGAVVAMLGMTFADNPWLLTLGMAGLGAALGLVLPGNLAAMSLLTGVGAQAKVAGINGLAQGVGMALGPLLGAALHQFSVQAPYALGAVILLVLCVLAWRATSQGRSLDVRLRSPSGRTDGRGSAC